MVRSRTSARNNRVQVPRVVAVLNQQTPGGGLTPARVMRLLSSSTAMRDIPQLRPVAKRTKAKPCCGGRRKSNALALVPVARQVIQRLPAREKQRAYQLMGLR